MKKESGGENDQPVQAHASLENHLLTIDEVAVLLRTTRKAAYAMLSRDRLPGVTRIGRRVLIHKEELLDWLDQKRASSLRS